MPSSSNVHGPVTGILIIRICLISAGSAGFESWELADDHPANRTGARKSALNVKPGAGESLTLPSAGA